MSNFAEEKQKIRQEMKNLLQNFPISLQKSASQIITRKLQSFKTYQEAKTVCFYVSKDQEVNTHELIQEELERKSKKIIIPKVTAHQVLKFFKITNWSDLEKGKFDIWEPQNYCPEIAIENIDAFIIPGLAFDSHCHRLGRGKAYYDFALREYQKAKIGLSYDFQIVELIPTDSHDVTLNYVLSETHSFAKNK